MFFWDEGCPYCKKAKTDILEKSLEEKITIEYIKISDSEENQDLFLNYVRDCNLQTASIPMVVINKKCSVGYPTTVESIEKAIAGDGIIESNEILKGKQNTEILLISIPAFLLLLVGYGLFTTKKVKHIKNVVSVVLAVFLLSLISATKTFAICPLCTVAVGAGLGFSRYFGIDDLITSVWIGGILTSFSLMTAEKISSKFKIKWYLSELLSILLFFGMTFIPFHFLGITGNELNSIWGIDKILLGTVAGSIMFYIFSKLYFLTKEKMGTVLFPYQKVVFPVTSLWLCTLISYIILYII